MGVLARMKHDHHVGSANADLPGPAPHQETHSKGVTSSLLKEEMTVAQVIRLYPQTKVVFDSLSVNPLFEGSDCLDEVAWHRGMDVDELVGKLEEVIGRSGGNGGSHVARRNA